MALAAIFLEDYVLLSQENEVEKSNLSLDRRKLLFPGEKGTAHRCYQSLGSVETHIQS